MRRSDPRWKKQQERQQPLIRAAKAYQESLRSNAAWNACLDACIAVVCPTPHKEEERACCDIALELEKLRKPCSMLTHSTS